MSAPDRIWIWRNPQVGWRYSFEKPDPGSAAKYFEYLRADTVAEAKKPNKVTDAMYRDGLSYVYGKGAAWSVHDLYNIMEKARLVEQQIIPDPVSAKPTELSEKLLGDQNASSGKFDSEVILSSSDGDVHYSLRSDDDPERWYPDGFVMRCNPRLRDCVRLTLESRDEEIALLRKKIKLLEDASLASRSTPVNEVTEEMITACWEAQCEYWENEGPECNGNPRSACLYGLRAALEVKAKTDSGNKLKRILGDALAPQPQTESASSQAKPESGGQISVETSSDEGEKQYTNDERMKWLHSAEAIDKEGYEWGVFRVRYEHGNLKECWRTNSDSSDVDAVMRGEK